MLKYIIAGAVLSAAFLWSYVSDDRIISFIEKDLTTQLNSVAPKTSNDLFEYIVAGRDVIIQVREFGREDEIDTLQQQIASVGGVDNIFLVGSVPNPATAPAIAALSRSGSNKLFVDMQIDNNVLTVTGNASAPKATEIVLQKLRDSKGTEVNNYLDFYPGIPSSQWLKHLEILTSRLPTAGNLLITESGVSHGGIFGNAKILDSVRAPLQIAEAEAAAAAAAAAAKAEAAAAAEAEAAAAAEAEAAAAAEIEKLEQALSAADRRSVELTARPEAPETEVNSANADVKTKTGNSNSETLELRNAIEQQLAVAKLDDLKVNTIEHDQAVAITLGVKDLYQPAGASLTREGSSTLNKIGKILEEHPSWRINVEGHTDSTPIDPKLRKRYPSNQELSSDWASVVVKFFKLTSNLNTAQLSSKGYAETQPVADNASAQGREQNRRVEIILRR